MLPRDERISKEAEIRAILRTGSRKTRTPLLDLVIKPNHTSKPRLLVITKKALGKAVQRNRIKRRIKGAYLKIRHNINENNDMVVFPKPDSGCANFDYLASLMLKSANNR